VHADRQSAQSAQPAGERLVLSREGRGDRVPAVWLAPRGRNASVAPTLVVHPKGIAGIAGSTLVKTLLSRGGIVMSIDAFQTGSAIAPRDTSSRAFTSYNLTNDQARMQDIVTALEYLRSRSQARTVNLVGLESAGLWAYFARAVAGDGVNLVADLGQFAADTDAEYLKNLYVPGLRKAGDFRSASFVNTQGRQLIYNAGPQFPSDWANEAAKLSGSELDLRNTSVDEPGIITWLTATRPAARKTN
jgi:hypothetical protein